MTDLKLAIQEKLVGHSTPKEYAQVICDLGNELMESGQLDSDELIWEVARGLWKEFDANFEFQVSDEYHKIVEAM